MEIPVEIVNGGIMGAVVLLLGNSGTLIRLHQKLSDHIKDEETNQATLQNVRDRLRKVERKLPNGEIGLMYRMLKDMYKDRHEGSLGKFADEVEAVERAVKIENEQYAVELREEVFGDLDPNSLS